MVRPHGLSGRAVVELWTNRPERLAAGSVLDGPDGPLEVDQATRVPGSGTRERWLVSFRGVGDHDAAEGLRGAVLRAEALADPSAMWVHDLVGARVSDASGRFLGTVESVEANPASDLLVLEEGGLIPLAFVTAQPDGSLLADVPPGLLDP